MFSLPNFPLSFPFSFKMERSFNSVTRPRSTQLLFLLIIPFLCTLTWPCTAAAAQELRKGFETTPNPSISSFQSLLNDSSGKFSFGFLRVNSTQLALAVLHVPSNEPLWMANSTTLSRWSDGTKVFFNGSLVISDPRTRTFWSTQTQGDKLVLLNNSNLQIQNGLDNSNNNVNVPTVLWQSFDHPTNTLVETQNFTSTMTLVSSNGLYSMRLGIDFIGLYAKFDPNSNQIYWKHKALQAKAQIVEGGGPIHLRVDPDGWLGMYQNETAPVDVESFNSFQRTLDGLLMVRLEPDGNLKAYYWSGSSWVLDYQAISDTCDLPNPCGSYGLCTPGTGCSCLDNSTELSSGECPGSGSHPNDLCTDPKTQNDTKVLRREGVDVPFKELMRYETMPSLEECENTCERNCSCYGVVYNNASGFCYILDYPIQTLMGTGDDSKVGYFKINKETKKKRMDPGLGVGIGLLGAALLCLVGAIGFGSYKIWMNKRRVSRMLEEETGGAMSGPYKDLGSASFRSIEMCSATHR